MKKQGHISGHMSLFNIAKKHGVTDSELRSELKKGIKVEQEHTSNVKVAARIALDRLFENPKYYTKLAKLKLENHILNEYSNKIINQLIDKFKQEKPNLSPNIIQSYIERFSQIKDSPRVSEKDILKYSWKELENIVDSNQPKRIKAGKINDGEPNSDANLVYNQNGLRIYLGKDKKSCIKYGNGYSFCISARGGNNMYNDYRYEQKGTPYFVFDDTKSSEQDENGNFIDPTHLLVIFTFKQSEDEYQAPYTVTTADNPGEDQYNDFKYIENKYPRLKGLRNVFKSTEPENKEKAEYELELNYDHKINATNREFENLWKLDPEQNHFTFGSINSALENLNNFINNKTSPYLFSGRLKPTANPDNYISSGVTQYRFIPIGSNPEKERENFINDIIVSMYDGPGDSKESAKNWDITYAKENTSTPEYKWYFNQIKRLVDTYNNKLSQLNLVKENQSLKDNIINEYSDKIINQLIDKFKQEDPELTDDEIKKVIKRFDQIKDNIKQRDILKYTWDNLIDTVTSYEPKRIKAGKINNGEVDNADLVSNKNGVRVYKAGSKKACIKYGNNYSFCISARGTGNAYSKYRVGVPDESDPSLAYFVFDDNRPSGNDEEGYYIDPTHLLVVMANEPYDGFQTYTITEADNYSTDFFESFEEAVQAYPQLKGLKDILIYEPPSDADIDVKIYNIEQEREEALENYNSEHGIIDLPLDQETAISLIKGSSQIYQLQLINKYHNDLDDVTTYMVVKNDEQLKDKIKYWSNTDWDVKFKKVPMTDEIKKYVLGYIEVADKYNKQISKIKLQSLKENQSLKNKSLLNKELVKEFMKHVKNELKLDSLPKIKLSNDSQEAVKHGSWGGYRPGEKSIRIVTAKRHPADIFRTLAHELVHYKQDLTGRLKPGDGKTGSDVENEANSRAAIIMRNFAEAKPKLFEHLITELSYGLENALPDNKITYIGGKNNEYIFSTYKDGKKLNDYKVAFKPDGESTYERVYHTTNRPLGKNFDDTQEGVVTAVKVNATVMKITLDFMKRNPNFTMIYIVPISRSRFTAVKKFIENNLPSNYSFEAESNDKGEDIIAIYNSPTPLNESLDKQQIINIAKEFMASDSYNKSHDCKRSTYEFVDWLKKNKKFEPEVLLLAPPQDIKKFPGKSGDGDSHIFTIIDGYGVDFTANQFPGINEPLKITPENQIPSEYKKIGGYYTSYPDWFEKGKTSLKTKWNNLPSWMQKSF